MKKAVIFDLDGTLINSIPLHFKNHQKVIKEITGWDLSEDYFYQHCNGRSALEFYAAILKEQKLPQSLLEHMKQLDEKVKRESKMEEKVKLFTGVKPLLKKLQSQDVKLAVATSSTTSFATTILENNAVDHLFDVIISRDQVEKSKPDPAIFLLARKELAVPKKECVVIEDAYNGFKAAKRAGIDCVGVTSSLTKKEMKPFVTTSCDHKSLLTTLEKL